MTMFACTEATRLILLLYCRGLAVDRSRDYRERHLMHYIINTRLQEEPIIIGQTR